MAENSGKRREYKIVVSLVFLLACLPTYFAGQAMARAIGNSHQDHFDEFRLGHLGISNHDEIRWVIILVLGWIASIAFGLYTVAKYRRFQRATGSSAKPEE